jgi:hypothetical protein
MSDYKKPVSRKCGLCGKRFLATHPKKLYCQHCSHFHRRMECSQLSPMAMKSIMRYVRKSGYTCDYSGVSLDLKDFASPWHYNFSYPDKGNPNKMVLAAALFTVMKMDLTKPEFRYYVLQLHDNRTKHTKIKKRPIIHWNRLSSGGCCICGQPKLSTQSVYCPTCFNTARRMRLLRLPAKTRQAIWDYIRKYGYVCYYTGMPLELKNWHDPWYCVFDHYNPRDSNKVVITSFLVNEMKNDLTEDEFWYYIAQLANHFRKGTPVRKKKLKYWSRHYVPS